MQFTHPLYDLGPYRISIRCSETLDDKLQPFAVRHRGTGETVHAQTLSGAINYACAHGRRPDTELSPVPLPVFAGTSLICVHQGRMLTGIRGQECGHGRGFLSFPGGKLDFGTDVDTGAAALREFRDETGRVAVLHNTRWMPTGKARMHPELFTTNCYMVEDGVHYVTFYVPGAPTWEVDPTEAIPGVEPTKCAEWKWRTLGEVASYLLGKENWEMDEISSIPPAKTQWMPIPELIAHKNDLGIVW